MTEEPEHNREHDAGTPGGHAFSQDFKHAPVGARIPEKVRVGVFCTGTMILQTNDEFVIDFVSTMVQPQQLVARVIMTAGTFARLAHALKANVAGYEQQLGPLLPRPASATPAAPPKSDAPAAPPKSDAPAAPPFYPAANPLAAFSEQTSHQPQQSPPPSPPPPPPSPPPPGPQPSIAELYDQLKLPDELLAGAFANVVMIRHTPEEFCFDFIASFYPRPVVTNRIFLAAGRVPALVDAMSSALRKYQQGPGRAGPDKPPQS